MMISAGILQAWMWDRTPPRVETEEWWREHARRVRRSKRIEERHAR
jgi:hypothetical protein